MKKVLAVIAVILATACLATGCGVQEVKAYNNPSEVIETNANGEFIIEIALPSNPTTGYTWVATFDTSLIELVEDTYEADNTDEMIVGGGGTQYLKFKALKSGEATITLDYQRPWEKESIDQKVFTINIE
jgi:inhibitor of cysteine peptidase